MRVLHVGSTLDIAGGIESFIFNTYKCILNENIVFDFLLDVRSKNEGYRSVVESRGGRIYSINWDRGRIWNYIYKYKIYRKYRNEIIHIHTNCGSRVIDGTLARIGGCKHVIFHSHTCKGRPPLKYKVLQFWYRVLGNQLFACSNDAGRYFFGECVLSKKKYHMIYNAIDTDEFVFKNEIRKNIRENLDVSSDDLLVAFVGRFSPEKNIGFVINIFEEMLKKINCKLLLVGTGEELEKIKMLIREKQLDNKAIILGERRDVSDLLSAIDVLLLPSQYEGLGIILIEAQSIGVRCFISDRVPKEVKVTQLLKSIPLEYDSSTWAEKICDSNIKVNNTERENAHACVENSRYNVLIEAPNIVGFYMNMLKS